MSDEVLSEPNFPTGWDAARVQKLIDHYETLSEDEQVAEDEAVGRAQLQRVPFGGEFRRLIEQIGRRVFEQGDPIGRSLPDVVDPVGG